MQSMNYALLSAQNNPCMYNALYLHVLVWVLRNKDNTYSKLSGRFFSSTNKGATTILVSANDVFPQNIPTMGLYRYK